MLSGTGADSIETRTAMVRMMQAMRPSKNGRISTGKSMLARRSDTVRDVVFTNDTLFPSFSNLPISGNERSLRTHYREGCFNTYLPIRAWFFLAEITNPIDIAVKKNQQYILVRDIDGRDNIRVMFHNKSAKNMAFDYTLLIQGYTVCIRFASRQQNDSDVEIDENYKKIYIFPTALQVLLTTMSDEINNHVPLRPWVRPSDAQILAHCINKTAHKLHYEPPAPNHCWNCKMMPTSDSDSKLMKCVRCMTALYCGKLCQTEHWTASHKRCCKSYKVYFSMLQEVKETLNNMAKYLFEFVSTDEEDGGDENDEDEEEGDDESEEDDDENDEEKKKEEDRCDKKQKVGEMTSVIISE
ncbi:hypothetical protein I4U23_004379 [Adineta vaga]|nr:hypothetical protein I4U23_004379 [Adineta vaga]